MKEYLFIFRNNGSNTLSPEELQKNMQKWGGWIKKLSEEGKFKAGDPLGNEARTISGKKKTVTDGPFLESKEMVGGYLIVTASDLDEACEIAKDCPIFEYGGSTEVRDISQLMM